MFDKNQEKEINKIIRELTVMNETLLKMYELFANMAAKQSSFPGAEFIDMLKSKINNTGIETKKVETTLKGG